MAIKKTLYDILGVSQTASVVEIEAAFRSRMEVLEAAAHRDSNAIAFAREAYQILSSASQRDAYDASLATAANPVPRPRSSRPLFNEDSDEPGIAWWKFVLGALVMAGVVLWWWNSRKLSAPGVAPAKVVKGDTRVIVVAPRQRIPADPQSRGPADAAVTADGSAPAPAVVAGSRSPEEVFVSVSPSVARITVSDAAGNTTGIGSGVVIGSGTVITNCHVALRGATISVKAGTQALPGIVETADEEFDLCRLRVTGLSAPAVSIGSVQSLRVGQRVFAIGAPQGLDLTMSEGIVSALRDTPNGQVIQTTAPVSPGSSGGGLFDPTGRLVGIVTFQHRFGQNLNFAVPADWISSLRQRAASAGPADRVTPQASPRKPTREEVIAACGELAEDTARFISEARRQGVSPGSLITSDARTWVRGVQDYMLHAAETARHLSEREIARLGTSYCVERAPVSLQ